MSMRLEFTPNDMIIRQLTDMRNNVQRNEVELIPSVAIKNKQL